MLNPEQRFPWELHHCPQQPAYKALALEEFFHFSFCVPLSPSGQSPSCYSVISDFGFMALLFFGGGKNIKI